MGIFSRFKFFGDSNKSNWNLINCEIEQDLKPYEGPEIIGNNFYISGALCPYCNRTMFKTVFPVGKEYKISASNGEVEIKRVFTCPLCKVFFAPIPGYRVTDGKVFERKLVNEKDYISDFVQMDACGSLYGRSDL